MNIKCACKARHGESLTTNTHLLRSLIIVTVVAKNRSTLTYSCMYVCMYIYIYIYLYFAGLHRRFKKKTVRKKRGVSLPVMNF